MYGSYSYSAETRVSIQRGHPITLLVSHELAMCNMHMDRKGTLDKSLPQGISQAATSCMSMYPLPCTKRMLRRIFAGQRLPLIMKCLHIGINSEHEQAMRENAYRHRKSFVDIAYFTKLPKVQLMREQDEAYCKQIERFNHAGSMLAMSSFATKSHDALHVFEHITVANAESKSAAAAAAAASSSSESKTPTTAPTTTTTTATKTTKEAKKALNDVKLLAAAKLVVAPAFYGGQAGAWASFPVGSYVKSMRVTTSSTSAGSTVHRCEVVSLVHSRDKEKVKVTVQLYNFPETGPASSNPQVHDMKSVINDFKATGVEKHVLVGKNSEYKMKCLGYTWQAVQEQPTYKSTMSGEMYYPSNIVDADGKPMSPLLMFRPVSSQTKVNSLYVLSIQQQQQQQQ
jgi:hypothetical protein